MSHQLDLIKILRHRHVNTSGLTTNQAYGDEYWILQLSWKEEITEFQRTIRAD